MLRLKRHSAARAKRSLRGFGRGEQGVAAVEFALILPVVLVLMFGCFEVPRFVLIYQKVARTAAGVADLVSQADEPMTADQLSDVYSAAGAMMEPYNIVTDGRVFISSINNSAGTGATVTWKRNNGSLGGVNSTVGAVGAAPTLPAGLTPAAGESVIVAEVYFRYTPIFANVIYSGANVYRASYIRPRNDNLLTGP